MERQARGLPQQVQEPDGLEQYNGYAPNVECFSEGLGRIQIRLSHNNLRDEACVGEDRKIKDEEFVNFLDGDASEFSSFMVLHPANIAHYDDGVKLYIYEEGRKRHYPAEILSREPYAEGNHGEMLCRIRAWREEANEPSISDLIAKPPY